jgi:hypothetical protein
MVARQLPELRHLVHDARDLARWGKVLLAHTTDGAVGWEHDGGEGQT